MRRILLGLSLLAANPVLAGHELDNRDLRNGRVLYAENCAACHGARLEGQPNWREPDENGVLPAPPHDETGHTWHHDNRLLFDYTKLGGEDALALRGVTGIASGMPGFSGTLTDADIWDTLAFIRSQWPPRVQAVQDARNPPH